MENESSWAVATLKYAQVFPYAGQRLLTIWCALPQYLQILSRRSAGGSGSALCSDL